MIKGQKLSLLHILPAVSSRGLQQLTTRLSLGLQRFKENVNKSNIIVTQSQ